MINTVWGTNQKPIASRQLSTLLESISTLEGTLYIGYPIIGTPEGPYPFDALLLSPDKGVIVFSIIEGKELGPYVEQLDECYTKLQSKLLQHTGLSKGRRLNIPITTIAFAPAFSGPAPENEDAPLTNEKTLIDAINRVSWSDNSLYADLTAALQAITTIRKNRKRKEPRKADSLGARMKSVDDSIANLDSHQSEAVIETVDGVQRIRGLAGSGKTIVLALKVAYLHAQNPDWKIAVTFNTRSLKGQFERLINTFVIEQTNEEPDWSQIDIINAWGAPGGATRDGIYYKFCGLTGVDYLDFRSADSMFGSSKSFTGVCEKALSEYKSITPVYDVILVDEAQDFSAAFLKLCYLMLREPKRLVYAYDELQTLTDSSLGSPEDIFGTKSDGSPVVEFSEPTPGKPRQDIILEKCYRNSRPLLATAHALGFGIYRQPSGLIQIFEQKDLWLDVGYEVKSGKLEDDQFVSLQRTSRTSPEFLEKHSDIEELIQFQSFSTPSEQTAWLCKNVASNIREDELDPEDILVINPNPLTTRDAVAPARAALLTDGINSSLAGVTTSADVFHVAGAVTFTGIFRAKGNEAAMVYIINAQDCYHSGMRGESAKARNRLFTAITRSKAWVRVLGVGSQMERLVSEFEAVKAKNFTLDFVYPNKAAREQLKIVNRDLTRREREKLKKGLGSAENLLSALEEGDLAVEDLPPDVIQKLRGILDKPKSI